MKIYALAFICSLLVSLAAGYTVLPILKKLRVRQTINEFGPESHAAKQGIPTMGGIGFLIAGLICALAFGFCHKNDSGYLFLLCIGMTLSFGAIGFLDDYLKVVKHRSVGLTVKQKFAPQILLAIGFSVLAYFDGNIPTALVLPFTETTLSLGWFYIPFMAFVIVAVDNSANILDGLDGLLGGNSTIALFFMGIYAAVQGARTGNGSMQNAAVFCLCISGAVFAFTRINSHPASVFMGDVGSLGIGGAISAFALVSGGSLLLPFMCVTMLISSASDLMQIAYMRFHKGRKLMRMSPLHHHLELGGIPETKVVNLYNIITAVGCAAAMILFG